MGQFQSRAAVTLCQMGVSEQDMVSFAAGLAISGMLPVVHTCAPLPQSFRV